METKDRVRKFREKKGLSTTDLSKLTGISQSTISKLENGKRQASPQLIEKLAKALDVSTERLTGEAASAIIEDRLKEKGMTLEEVADKTDATLYWLENLDTFTPWNQEQEIGYIWITQVAHVLGLSGARLRAALARQEPPTYNGPMGNAAEDFADHVEEDLRQYINDNEAIDYLDEIHKRPEMKALFQVGRKASKEDIETAITIIEALKKKSSED